MRRVRAALTLASSCGLKLLAVIVAVLLFAPVALFLLVPVMLAFFVLFFFGVMIMVCAMLLGVLLGASYLALRCAVGVASVLLRGDLRWSYAMGRWARAPERFAGGVEQVLGLLDRALDALDWAFDHAVEPALDRAITPTEKLWERAVELQGRLRPDTV